MNKRIFVALSSFLGAISLPSCSDDVSVQLDILGADEYVQIYMPSAGRLENIKTVYIQEDVQSFDVSAYYGGPKYPTQDLFIEFEFRPDLVDAFNEKNGTNYAAMPEGSYSMPATAVKLAKGELQSEPLAIEIVAANYMEVAKPYLLPIRIKSTSGTEPVKESLRTAYYLITGSYLPGQVPREKVYSFGAPFTKPICVRNADVIYMTEENNLVYLTLGSDGTYGNPTAFGWGWGGCDWLACMEPGRLLARYNGNINCYNLNDAYNILGQSTLGQGWGFLKQLVLFKDLGILAVSGDALNKYPFVPGGAAFDFPLCGGLVNSGWGSYNYLLNYGSNILAVDANGDMWAFPLSDTFVLGAPHKIGTGWDIYTTVLACGEQLLALDTNGDLWRYEFNPTAFWPLTGDEPVTPEEGDGILAE